MQSNEIASLALVLVGVGLNVTSRTKTIVPQLKLSSFGYSHIAFFIFLIYLVGPMLTLMAFIFLYHLKKELIITTDEIVLTKTTFVGSLLSTIKFWPYLFVLSYISHALLPDWKQQQNVIELQNSNGIDIFINIVLACLFAPIVEEILFRKILYPLLKKYVGIFWGACFSSLLFSAIHYNVLSFALLFLFSMFLTYLYERHSSLSRVIFSHSVFNIIMSILIVINQ